jgi:hypothetical protein
MVATRVTNATTHPGLRNDPLPKRKRRTAAEMTAARAEIAATKAAKEKEKQRGVTRIAELESRMADEDANDITPRPNFNESQRRISRTASYAVIPMTFNKQTHDYIQDLDDGDQAPNYNEAPRSDDGGDTEVPASSTEEDRKPKKKGRAHSDTTKKVSILTDGNTIDNRAKAKGKGVTRKAPKPVNEDMTGIVEVSSGEDNHAPKKRGKAKGVSREVRKPVDEDIDIVMLSEEGEKLAKKGKLRKEPVRGAIKAAREEANSGTKAVKEVGKQTAGILSKDSDKIR